MGYLVTVSREPDAIDERDLREAVAQHSRWEERGRADDGRLEIVLQDEQKLAWLEDGVLRCVSPSDTALGALIELAALLSATVSGEDGEVFTTAGPLDEVRAAVAQGGEDPGLVHEDLAGELVKLADPAADADEKRAAIETVRALAGPVRRAAALYLLARGIEAHGDPEPEVIEGLVMLRDVAGDLLRGAAEPIPAIAARVEQYRKSSR